MEKLQKLFDEVANECVEHVQERTDIKNAIKETYWVISKDTVIEYLLNYTPNDEYESTSREAGYLFALNELKRISK